MEILNYANSKETESLAKSGCRQKCLDKSLIYIDIQSAQISQKQDGHNIYSIMKTMCPPSYHHKGFVATRALRHMMYGYTSSVQVYEVPQSYCGDRYR